MSKTNRANEKTTCQQLYIADVHFLGQCFHQVIYLASGLFQRNWGSSKIHFQDCLEWSKHFLESFNLDDERAKRGASLYHGMYKEKNLKPKKRRRSRSPMKERMTKRARRRAADDHRGPDTAERMSSASRRTSRSLVPTIPWIRQLPRLQWGINYAAGSRHPLGYPSLSDTCALDTPLTMFYLLWEREIMTEEKIFDSLHPEVVLALRQIRNGNWDHSRRELYRSMRLLDEDLRAQLFQTFDEDTRKNLSAFFSSDVTVEKLLRPDKRVGTNSLLSFRRSVYEDVTTDVTTAFANSSKRFATTRNRR